MTPPRDVQDYEAQARVLWVKELLFARPEKEGVAVLAAALCAAERAALERAAQVADEEHSEAWKSSRAADARGDHRVGVADAHSASAAQRIAERIRALIAPAPKSPLGPAAEDEPPYWRIGRHYGIHVYCGDTPIATFHTVEAAQAAVRAYNASLDRPGAATGEEG